MTRLLPVLLAVLLAVTGAPAPTAVAQTAAAETDGPEVRRLSGADRVATATAISRDAFPDGAAVVHVATGERFPDALAAGPAAAAAGGPVLLVSRDQLPEATRDELQRLSPERVVVVGGQVAIADDVLEDIAAATGADVARVAGPTREGTAAALSAAGTQPGIATVFVASGQDFPDALAGGGGRRPHRGARAPRPARRGARRHR
jgi:putative cell wall-binding protein